MLFKATSCGFLASAVGPDQLVGHGPLFDENNVITAIASGDPITIS